MSDSCGHHGCAAPAATQSPRYRRVLWIALWVNAAMFGIEIAGGLRAGSVSLLADAVDFFGDAANYGLALAGAGHGLALARPRGAVQGPDDGGLRRRSCWAGRPMAQPSARCRRPPPWAPSARWRWLANVAVAVMLYAWRDGDANMRSVWLCTRNDAIGNVAVMAAALGVFGTGSAWPDLAVAAVMGLLAPDGGALGHRPGTQ